VACGRLAHMFKTILPFVSIAVLLLAGGCGSGAKTSAGASSQASAVNTTQSEGAGALAADAKSAATGDIPDNQNFLTFRDPHLGASMLYPEGWTIRQVGSTVTIKEKNNLVHIQLARASVPTVASVQAALAGLSHSDPTLKAGTPTTIALHGGPAIKVVYTTESAPNPVTGKRVTLTVDRYVLAHSGRVATVDLGTPVGVDNVDAYRRMIESFKWQ
jgi:hypothetical protein